MIFLEEIFRGNSVLLLTLASVLFFVLIILLIFLLSKIKKIDKKSAIFFKGKEGKDLEQLILAQQKNISELNNEVQELFELSAKLHKLANRGIHKVGFVRFNPFKDMGGNQSWVIALLDGKNSGITISSLYTREGTRIYTKKISGGKSESSTLTDEELKAISGATITKK